MKTTCVCVVQGNIRRGTSEVLSCLSKQFDHIVLSTWEDEYPHNIPQGKFELVLNQKPANAGFTHRNYQRLSTAVGIKFAEKLGASHILKWRTDMLPTKLDVDQLLRWSDYHVPEGVTSRVVTCAFRNLTVRQDWFSSIPDLFAFADVEMIKLLWGADSFDFTKKMNIPEEMLQESGAEWVDRPDALRVFCPESELYAIFKKRLQNRLQQKLNHLIISKNYMYLIAHNRLGICWFSGEVGFRSITQSLQHPWWTELIWKYGKPIIVEKGYAKKYWFHHLIKKGVMPAVIKYNLLKQRRWYRHHKSLRES